MLFPFLAQKWKQSWQNYPERMIVHSNVKDGKISFFTKDQLMKKDKKLGYMQQPLFSQKYSSHELINNPSVAFHMLLIVSSMSNSLPVQINIDCHKNHRKYYQKDYIKNSCRLASSKTAEVVKTRG